MNPSKQTTARQENATGDYSAVDQLDEYVNPTEAHEVFLNANVVEPGDVLITLGTGATAKAIQVFSNATYSHAAVWLPLASGNVMLAESDVEGVGFTPKLPTMFNKIDTLEFARAYAVPSVRRYKLLRHPNIGAVPQELLIVASEKLQQQHFSLPYPHLSLLLNAVDIPASLRNLAQKTADLVRKPEPLSGSFCSELVGLYFEKIGLPLFADSRAACSIAPDHLVAEDCLLKEVEGAFLAREAFDGWSRKNPLLLQSLQRENFLPYAVSSKRRRYAMSELVKSVDSLVPTFVHHSIDCMRELQEVLENVSMNCLQKWISAGATEQAQEADLVASQSKLLSCLIDAIETQERAYSGSIVCKENLAWASAVPELVRHYTTVQEELMQEVLQSDLHYLAYMQAQMQDTRGTRPLVALVKNAPQRVRNWFLECQASGAAAGMPSAAMPVPQLNALAMEHVMRTWHIAMQAMSMEVASVTAQRQQAAMHNVQPGNEDVTNEVYQPRS